jgi:HTH-type transcriptional regulator/antitoxin HigA
MEITPIKNMTQYEAYVAEAGRLVAIDPVSDSNEGKTLSLLAIVIEDFEKSRFSFDKPSPVDAILFRMEQQGLSQVDLVPYLGSRSRVSEVLAGKRPLTLPMIRNLSEGLGIPASILIQESNSSPDLVDKDVESEEEQFDLQSFPIAEMVKRSWLPKVKGTAKKYPVDQVQNFFAPIGGVPAIGAFWRKSSHQKTITKSVSYSLIAWAGKVLLEAEKVALPVSYRDGTITTDFKATLAHLSLLDNGPVAAKEFLNKCGIVVVIEPHLNQTKLDGAAMLLHGKIPVIGLTLRHDRLDNFWFTLMHEVIHIERHLFKGHTAFFDDLEQVNNSEIEREANRESGEALVPMTKLKRSMAFKLRTETEVRKLAEELRVHPAIVAGRIRFELKDYQLLNRLVGSNKVRSLFETASSEAK